MVSCMTCLLVITAVCIPPTSASAAMVASRMRARSMASSLVLKSVSSSTMRRNCEGGQSSSS